MSVSQSFHGASWTIRRVIVSHRMRRKTVRFHKGHAREFLWIQMMITVVDHYDYRERSTWQGAWWFEDFSRVPVRNYVRVNGKLSTLWIGASISNEEVNLSIAIIPSVTAPEEKMYASYNWNYSFQVEFLDIFNFEDRCPVRIIQMIVVELFPSTWKISRSIEDAFDKEKDDIENSLEVRYYLELSSIRLPAKGREERRDQWEVRPCWRDYCSQRCKYCTHFFEKHFMNIFA